ncbi:hypothetical protein [Paenibacillus sp. GCM10027626]|uniref:hypothetical protein n=1 Tax=Paenibacillus sp. GCM10027626 TaxID=3273411 RepID=UPI00363687E3
MRKNRRWLKAGEGLYRLYDWQVKQKRSRLTKQLLAACETASDGFFVTSQGPQPCCFGTIVHR